MARHSDIRLTMGVYTHIALNDQSSAIELLPAPPELRSGAKVTKETNGKGDLEALWAELAAHVKAGLLATVKVGREGNGQATLSGADHVMLLGVR